MKQKNKPNLAINVSELEIQSALLSAHTILLKETSKNSSKTSLDDSPKSDGDEPSCTPLYFLSNKDVFEIYLKEKKSFHLSRGRWYQKWKQFVA